MHGEMTSLELAIELDLLTIDATEVISILSEAKEYERSLIKILLVEPEKGTSVPMHVIVQTWELIEEADAVQRACMAALKHMKYFKE